MSNDQNKHDMGRLRATPNSIHQVR